MYTTSYSQDKPEEMEYRWTGDLAEVFLRKNVQKENVELEEGGKITRYTYDEVYFRTTETEATVKGDFDGFFESGKDWAIDVPLTQKERIRMLQSDVEQAQADIESSDSAIAELTMVLASMMDTEEV